MASWDLVARAAGVWRPRDGPPPPGVVDAAREEEVLAALHAAGCSSTAVELRSSSGREVRGILLEPAAAASAAAAPATTGGPQATEEEAPVTAAAFTLQEAPATATAAETQPHVVIYCPSEATGGAGGLEVAPLAGLLLSLQICVLALDLSVSHSYADASDIECAVSKLRDLEFRKARGWPISASKDGQELLPSIALWGRSAGANAALSYAATDPQVTALICDSAYSDLPSLLGLPSWMASPFSGLKRLAEDVAEASSCGGPQGGCSMLQPNGRSKTGNIGKPPWELATKLWMPALYVNGDADEQVPHSCARALRSSHAGEAQLLLVPGGRHASERPEDVLARMALFAHRATQRVGLEAERLRGAVERVARLALGPTNRTRSREYAPQPRPPSLPRAPSGDNQPLSTLLLGGPLGAGKPLSTGAGEWRDALLAAALQAYPCGREFLLAQPSAPKDASEIHFECSLTMPWEASEAVLAWTSSSGSAGLPNATYQVELVRLTRAAAEVVSVRLVLSRNGGLVPRVEHLAAGRLELQEMDAEVQVKLDASTNGEVQLQVGDVRLACQESKDSAAAGPRRSTPLLWLSAAAGATWAGYDFPSSGTSTVSIEPPVHGRGVQLPPDFDGQAAPQQPAAVGGHHTSPGRISPLSGHVHFAGQAAAVPHGGGRARRPFSVISGISSVSAGSALRHRSAPAGSLSLCSSLTSPEGARTEISASTTPRSVRRPPTIGDDEQPRKERCRTSLSVHWQEDEDAEHDEVAEKQLMSKMTMDSNSSSSHYSFGANGFLLGGELADLGLACVEIQAQTWPVMHEAPFERPLTWQAGDTSC